MITQRDSRGLGRQPLRVARPYTETQRGLGGVGDLQNLDVRLIRPNISKGYLLRVEGEDLRRHFRQDIPRYLTFTPAHQFSLQNQFESLGLSRFPPDFDQVKFLVLFLRISRSSNRVNSSILSLHCDLAFVGRYILDSVILVMRSTSGR